MPKLEEKVGHVLHHGYETISKGVKCVTFKEGYLGIKNALLLIESEGNGFMDVMRSLLQGTVQAEDIVIT